MNTQETEKEEYNYMARCQDIFAAIGEDDTIEGLLKAKSIIAEISSHIETTKLFTDSKESYEEYLAEINKIEDKKERAIQAWRHFLKKSINAPTRMHVRGVVILALPAVNKFLSEIE